jgi:Putative mono-oxygenase ydhR
MSACTVQINFELAVPKEQYLAHAESVLPAMRDLAGLIFKLWILSDDGTKAGGIYLFRDRASAERYVSSPLVQNLAASPAIRHVDVRVTPVHVGLSAHTAARVLEELGSG